MKIQQARARRKTKIRKKIERLQKIRVSVIRSIKNIGGQVYSEDGSRVLASASSLEKSIKEKIAKENKVNAAGIVGKILGERAVEAGVKVVTFDRAGYKYHGRVKALAEGLREAGLEL